MTKTEVAKRCFADNTYASSRGNTTTVGSSSLTACEVGGVTGGTSKRKMLRLLSNILDLGHTNSDLVKCIHEATVLWTQMTAQEHAHNKKRMCSMHTMQHDCERWLGEVLVILQRMQEYPAIGQQVQTEECGRQEKELSPPQHTTQENMQVELLRMEFKKYKSSARRRARGQDRANLFLREALLELKSGMRSMIGKVEILRCYLEKEVIESRKEAERWQENEQHKEAARCLNKENYTQKIYSLQQSLRNMHGGEGGRLDAAETHVNMLLCDVSGAMLAGEECIADITAAVAQQDRSATAALSTCVCVCVCLLCRVCVCERERERGREGERERGREGERERES
jgi:hypothetical protein